MLRKSPASNAWAAIFKKADFSWSSLKATFIFVFSIFSHLRLFSVFIINNSTFSSVNMERLKDGNVE